MTILLSILLLHFVAQLTPGPDILLISKIAMTRGKVAAIFSVIGITLGIAIWIIFTLTGFSIILEHWTWLQSIIMLFGALFLSKMGWAMLQSYRHYKNQKNSLSDNEVDTILVATSQPIQQSHWQYLSQGLFTNLANPKAVVYFASVFSLAIKSEELQNLKFLLGFSVVIETFLLFLLLAWGLSHPKIKPYYQKNEHYIDGIAGLLFIMFALFLMIDAIKGLLF